MIPDTRLTPTNREAQILELTSEGLTNVAVASKLGISVATVKNHLLNLHHRLNFRSTTQAVATALRNGWIN